MEFGGVFGITAPMMLLNKLSANQLNEINNLLSNKADNKFKLGFRQEIELIKNVYGNRFSMVPVDSTGKLKREYNNYKRSKQFWKSGGKGDATGRMTLEEVNKYEREVLPNLEMEIGTFRNIYGENEGKISKNSDDPVYAGAYKIATELYGSLGYLTNTVAKRFIVNKYEETTVFGVTLSSFLNQNSFYRQRKIVTGINKANGVIREGEIAKLRESLRLLDEYMSSTDTVETGKPLLPVLNELVKERGLKLNLGTLGKSKKSNSESLLELYTAFIDAYPQYRGSQVLPIIMNKKLIEIITFETLDMLEDLYRYCCSFTVEYYNSRFNLNLTKEQYIKVFRVLEDHGIIGLTLEARELFLVSLQKMYLTGAETKYDVPKDSIAYKTIEGLRKYEETLTAFGGGI